MSRSITFFDTQFQRQVTGDASALNPFELAVLPCLSGRLLDYGCGLGNLALAAARQGCTVLALDASPTAIGYLRAAAAHENLPVDEVMDRSHGVDHWINGMAQTSAVTQLH